MTKMLQTNKKKHEIVYTSNELLKAQQTLIAYLHGVVPLFQNLNSMKNVPFL